MILAYVLGVLIVFPIAGFLTVALLWMVGRTGAASLTTYALQVMVMLWIYGLISLPMVLKVLDDRKRTVLTLAGFLGFLHFCLSFFPGLAGEQSFSFTVISSLYSGIDGILIGFLAGIMMTALWPQLPRARNA